MDIKAKVYYEKSTGIVLTITPELHGSVKENTKDEDFKFYPTLKDININEVDYIELEYGTLETILNNIKSYKVNIENNQLECVYYTQAENGEINNDTPPLSEAEQLEIDNANLLLELVQKDILISQLQGGV